MTIIDNDDTPQVEETRTIVEDRPDPSVATQVRQAREMIPVGPTGATPMNFAQQVDFAKTMAMARSALPAHLRNNVGDCLAIIDISTRVGLSPYMVANKTYVQNDRLCFESQLFHAFAQASGLMRGEFEIEYEGEGAARVCIVTGYLRNDPRPKTHRSPPLADVHPGYVEKNGKAFVKGSPLWDRKPDVQLAYDTTRDWVRLYCPRATMGIYTPEEIEEYDIGPDGKNITVAPTIRDRLAAAAPSEEGHRPGFVDQELAQLAPDREQTIIVPAKAENPAEDAPRTRAAPAPVPEEPTRHDAPAGALRGRRGRRPAAPPTPAQVKAAADRAQQRAAEAEAAKPKEPEPKAQEPEKPIRLPETSIEYITYAQRWIEKATNRDDAEARWDGERDMRDDLAVPIKARNELHAAIGARFKEQP